jgi:hypothetical protein
MSTIYQTRTDFFETMAKRNKLIAHEVDGKFSFCRINDEEEYDAAISANPNIGYPLLIHQDFSIALKGLENVTLDKRIMNVFTILTKATDATRANMIQAAKDSALQVVWQCLSYIRNNNSIDTDATPCASVFENIDWDSCKILAVGPVNNNWYGWEVIFWDESRAEEVVYDEDEWHEA